MSDDKLGEFKHKIKQKCWRIARDNAKLVSGYTENTSGYMNAPLVNVGSNFVIACLDRFIATDMPDCDANEFIPLFLRYVYQQCDDFERDNYDPDGVGGGTITDITIGLQKQHEKYLIRQHKKHQNNQPTINSNTKN